MSLALWGWVAWHLGAASGPWVPVAKPQPRLAVLLLVTALAPGLVLADAFLWEIARVPGSAGTDSPSHFFEKGGIFSLLWGLLLFFGGRHLPRTGAWTAVRWTIAFIGVAMTTLLIIYMVAWRGAER